MYTSTDIEEAYEKLGLSAGQTVFVTSSLLHLFAFERLGKNALLSAHLQSLDNAIGPTGTLVFPAASLQICNTNLPFDLASTPSMDVGVLSEFARCRSDSYRSFHPFVSFVGRGARAEEIVSNCSRYSFGLQSPMDRMLTHDAICLSIGKHPRFTATLVHHVEQLMSVPYRYTKEFIHPVVRNSVVKREPFYMYVLYRDSDVRRNYNQRIFSVPRISELVRVANLGRGQVFAYSMRDFTKVLIELMLEDPYIWCEKHPQERPWQS